MKTENIGCFCFLHCMIKIKCELIQLLTPSQLCFEEKTAVKDSYTGFLKQNHPSSHIDTTAVFPLNIFCTRLLFHNPFVKHFSNIHKCFKYLRKNTFHKGQIFFLFHEIPLWSRNVSKLFNARSRNLYYNKILTQRSDIANNFKPVRLQLSAISTHVLNTVNKHLYSK